MIELENNTEKVIRVEGVSIHDVLALINLITSKVNTVSAFGKSPDPKDNFLFDLAIQTGSEVIVTKEKMLLGFTESPVPIKDIAWFKQAFEVPL